MYSFYNKEAFDMCVWSYEESNRIKASKIYQVALNMENRYRKVNGITSTPHVTQYMVTFPRSESMAAWKAKMK